MDKTCFIIMPITDSSPYEEGHFKRVYDFIIKPSVVKAGFEPIRADDVLNTNYIAIDVLRKIIKSDMAICDLSSKNPNVFYELGVRQAFDLPITFIKDSITERVFDIQGFRDIVYDENLRIDNVEECIKKLSETIKNTYESKSKEEVNSLISLLGIHPAKTSHHEISSDTEIILNTIQNLDAKFYELEKNLSRKTMPQLNLSFDYRDWVQLTNNEAKDLKMGDEIIHQKFGVGKILKIEGTKSNPIATASFQNGEKKLMLNYANLMRRPSIDS